MPTRRELDLAIRLQSALNDMRAINGEHVDADNLEWLAIKTLRSNQQPTAKEPEKCPTKTK